MHIRLENEVPDEIILKTDIDGNFIRVYLEFPNGDIQYLIQIPINSKIVKQKILHYKNNTLKFKEKIQYP